MGRTAPTEDRSGSCADGHLAHAPLRCLLQSWPAYPVHEAGNLALDLGRRRLLVWSWRWREHRRRGRRQGRQLGLDLFDLRLGHLIPLALIALQTIAFLE